MRPRDRIAAFMKRNPRAARAAGWALLGAAAALPGLWLVDMLVALEIPWLTAPWAFGDMIFTLAGLLGGLFYSGVLGVLLWRGGHAGRARAAGFALFAMFWLTFGVGVGVQYYCMFDCGPFGNFTVFATGFLATGAWMALAGLLFLPGLRRRAGAGLPFAGLARLLAAGLLGATLAGTAAALPIALLVEELLEDAWWEHIDPVVAVWAAAWAAALSWALPRR